MSLNQNDPLHKMRGFYSLVYIKKINSFGLSCVFFFIVLVHHHKDITLSTFSYKPSHRQFQF